MGLKEEVTRLAKSLGADLVGFAPASRLSGAPEGYRPMDVMREARAVISIAVKIPEAVIEASIRAHKLGEVRYHLPYLLFGYRELNSTLDRIALGVTRMLEGLGFKALPIPASWPSEWSKFSGAMSHRHAAVAAGLGELGWSGLLLTPEYGPRQRLTTVITSASIEPDPMYSGRKLCNPGECKACVAACPAKAIPEQDAAEAEIGGKVFKYAKLRKWRCRTAISLGPSYMSGIKPAETMEEYLAQARKADMWLRRLGEVGSLCGRCLLECPAPRC